MGISKRLKFNGEKTREEKQRSLRLYLIVIVAFAVGLAGAFLFDANVAGHYEKTGDRQPETLMTDGVFPPQISASGAILLDTTGWEKENSSIMDRVLFEENSNVKLYPASTTKIMTALVTLETLDELGLGIDSQVIVPKEAEGVEGSSIYLKAGERLTVEELLYGLMLQSGNDSAVALAICIGGKEELFVEKMNQRAAEIGCTATHFTNPNGLHDEDHYTTARELGMIASEAMKREDFRKIVSAKTWKSPASGRIITNKNKTIFQYKDATGIKIGYTMASGRTLVASAKRDDRELIAVVLNDGNWFRDAYSMMDYGFQIIDSERKG